MKCFMIRQENWLFNTSDCLIEVTAWTDWLLAGAVPGFQVRGGALKKIAQSGGRRENIWGISCEKSRFYAKKIMFSNFREGAPPPLLLDPPLRSICLSLSISNSFPVYVHAVFHFVSSLEIHNLYFGKHNKGDKSYKYMLQVANFHR